jgi:hypothetical protein
MLTLAILLVHGLAAAGPLVTFTPPPGSTILAASGVDQQVIREAIEDQIGELEALTGLKARPVTVRVFRTREEFVTYTQIPPDFGAITLDGTILMQPPAMLDHHQGLCRILAHEAVHHFFFKIGRRWPRAFHEGLAHHLSGGRIAESTRAAELAGRARTGAEEEEYEAHLAWKIEGMVRGVGREAFMKRLIRGELHLEEFTNRKAGML